MRSSDTDLPEALQGLGLTQLQRKGVQRYFALRVHYSRNQRRIALVLGLVLASNILTRYFLPSAGASDLPFESVVAVMARWAPVCFLVLGIIALGIQQAVVYHLRKRLPELGLSERAVHAVNELGDSVARFAFFHNKIPKG
jgi:hypothetical protein